jgi:hypothetical protein
LSVASAIFLVDSDIPSVARANLSVILDISAVDAAIFVVFSDMPAVIWDISLVLSAILTVLFPMSEVLAAIIPVSSRMESMTFCILFKGFEEHPNSVTDTRPAIIVTKDIMGDNLIDISHTSSGKKHNPRPH